MAFIVLIHPIQWTIANPVGADRPTRKRRPVSPPAGQSQYCALAIVLGIGLKNQNRLIGNS